MSYLDQLNDRQREAVMHVEGPLLVLAGAGSGKTRVITYKIAYLIDQVGVEPWRILAVTFTNKAADEMRRRVEQLLGSRELSSNPLISTFHSFCVRLLRRHIDSLQAGYTRDFSIYDDDDSQRLIKACLKDLRLDEKMLPPRLIQSTIGHAKSRGLSAESYQEQAGHVRDAKKQEIAKVFKLYEERLRAANALDFDDLLLKAVELLRKDAQVRAAYNERFRYILIDEYQDTNRPQFNLTRLLTAHSQNLCVVGDVDQSIYSFRGADIQNIIDFETNYPTANIITLDQNYRSTQRILAVANNVIKHNQQRKEKTLRTENERGEKITYYHAYNGDEEARFVVKEISQALSDGDGTGERRRAGVLYRTNAQSRLFEEACRREGISFNIVGGFSFYKRAEIRDIVAYLKLALNLWDDESVLRIINTPARGIGQKTIDAVRQIAREHQLSLWDGLNLALAEQMLPPRSLTPLLAFKDLMEGLAAKARTEKLSDLIRAAMHDTGYVQALQDKSVSAADPLDAENRLLNLEEMISAAVEAEERGETLRDFIDHAALVSDADDYNPDAPVTLMTMHSAKGLEFPVVFVVGLEEGLFPHARSIDDAAALEEERRLCYVAITRAQKRLYLTHARYRRLHGEEMKADPSRFLKEIPVEEIDDLSPGESWLAASGRADMSSPRSDLSPPKPKQPFAGKTYNSVESIQEFFKQKGIQVDVTTLRASKAETPRKRFAPGARVRHPKYGVGQIIKREGAGQEVKLTIRFPGFGDRKLMEAVAELEEI
jgi:DNA helicase-2/ATP-dependent DNA helicase PcrA